MHKQLHSAVGTIALFEFHENIRNWWLLTYCAAFLVLGVLITSVGSADPLRASASLLNLVLLLVPLFSLVFGSLSFSEALSFHAVLVALPISRRDIFLGKWLGLGTGLTLSFVIGIGLGALWQLHLSRTGLGSYLLLLALGVVLTFVFLSIAFLMVNLARRRELVFGWMLLLWFSVFVLYDLLIMGIVLVFGEYPLEVPMLLAVLANPIDLARVIFLLHNDLSAMMGYSGAVFQQYLGEATGIGVAGASGLLWVLVPFVLGLRRFQRRDL
ncbi:MAG: ABC transporter permease subunit [Deltaproteobacteria bacterium]|nr:ABC transporter permease subunit [Deltaproteobacteria bacterium]